MTLFNYECDEVKRIIKEVSPNYPQLTTYEKEWIFFHKYQYIPGIPVELEWQEVIVKPTGTVQNAIPYQYKRAILKGQTLVNISPFKTQTFVSNGNTYVGKTHYFNKDKTPIKKGKYTISFEVTSNQPTTDCAYWVNLYNNGSTSHNVKVDNTSTYGKFVVVLEVSKETNQIGFFATPNTSDITFVIDSVIVIEGDYTNVDIPYFEGMQSVKMPVLTTTGKNLFDGKLEFGDIDSTTGEPVNHPGRSRSKNFIKVIPSNSYFMYSDLPIDSTNFGVYIYQYDSNRNYIGLISVVEKNNINLLNQTFTVDDDCHFIKIRTTVVSTLNFDIGVMSDGKNYEPYKSNILTVNEEVELRAIGDVKDELNLLTGELTQRIGEIVLDGSDDEQLVLYSSQKLIYQGILYSDKYISNHQLKKIYYNKVDRFYIEVPDTITSISEARQWLSENNVIIQLPLVEESIKTVALTKLNKPYDGTNHYHLTANIPCEGIIEVPVVSTGEQTLQEINND